MLGNTIFEALEELSKGIGLSKIQNIFNTLISEIADYLKLKPLYQEIIIKIIDEENLVKREKMSILDFGVERIYYNNKLIIRIKINDRNLYPHILLRESFYCFIHKDSNDFIKVCINQIVENSLNRLPISKEWKKFIRDSLVDREFIKTQLDKLQKFFEIKAKDPLESSIQFFFREIRENKFLSEKGKINQFYDIIFERYAYKTSRSLFNRDILETLKVIIQIFYENKSYINISDYQAIFKEFKDNKRIKTNLSLRKFTENIQWINKCSSIAPSYDFNYSTIDLCAFTGIIKFNPLLEKNKIKILMEQWPFFHSPKLSENCFGTDISLFFIIPTVYSSDLFNYFNRLEESGYIKKKLYQVSKKLSSINLNYFTEISKMQKLINPNNINYDKEYEVESLIEYKIGSHPYPLSLFDFIILDRIRHLSVTGLTFDKRVETLNAIKEDVENALRKQIGFNQDFKKSVDKLLKYKVDFLRFLERNEKKGFFYLYYQLNQIINYISGIEKILDKYPEIKNLNQLQTILNTKVISQNIEEQLAIQERNIQRIIYQDFLSLYFRSVSKFRVEKEKFQLYLNVLDACYNLKIFNLNIVKKVVINPNLAKEIYQTREKRYLDEFKSISLYRITNEKIESTTEALLNHDPPIMKPLLINTILTSTYVKYYPEIILEDTPKVYNAINKLKIFFPRMFMYEMTDLDSKKKFIYLLIYFLNVKEKKLFLNILLSHFKGSIVTIKRYFWRGVQRLPRLAEDFYDFEKKKFIYIKELFEQLQTYSQIVLGRKLEWSEYPSNNNEQEIFFLKDQKFDNFINNLNKKVSDQKENFDLRKLNTLSEFRKNLEANLIDRDNFIRVKAKGFFERYINSIKFLPSFQKFGFSQSYLYIRPFFYKSPTFEIDFRLLFINSFQNIKYPASIEPNQAIFCEYIFPFRTPNKSYLNWLVKSKKNVSEYCLFYKKKLYDIIHFNRNLIEEGWNYSSIRFKSYVQDILFNPNYDPKIAEIKEFDLDEKSEPYIYGKGTKEYEDLIQIYDIQPIDIKSIIGTRQYSRINAISKLLKKKLIFPYLSIKNLDFQDKISIILPDTKREFNDNIIKIFSFFNMCRIYEIEGEYFIYGFQQEKTFENGFLIEIWFPKCELDEFFNIFDLLFQYLEIKHHIILTDLVNGKILLKSVYGNLDFLKEYNPLLNLIWNDKDKIWMNHKLFNEKFEPIYPDLIKREKK